jgi:hypothetical protein
MNADNVLKIERPLDWPPPPALTPEEHRRVYDAQQMTVIMLARDPAQILWRARLHISDQDIRGWSDWYAWAILVKAQEFEQLIKPRGDYPRQLPWD